MPGLRRRLLISALLVMTLVPGTLIALAVFQTLTGSSQKAAAQIPEVYFLSGSASSADALIGMSPEVASAHRVSSLDEVQTLSAGTPALIMVDEAYASGLAPGALHAFAAKGYALIGLNVPVDKLTALSEFDSEISSINAKFAGGARTAPATFAGPFFTVVWRTPPGANPAYWGQMQNDLKPDLFRIVVNDYRLRVRGLIMNQAGAVQPLEQYSEPAP